jgi:hypothetical protein
MQKTDKMLLIEARAGGRDIRELLREAYDRTGNVSDAADFISAAYGVPLSFGLFHDWVQAGGGSIRKTLEFPAEDRQPVEVG